jgi:hypothetical protein
MTSVLFHFKRLMVLLLWTLLTFCLGVAAFVLFLLCGAALMFHYPWFIPLTLFVLGMGCLLLSIEIGKL